MSTGEGTPNRVQDIPGGGRESNLTLSYMVEASYRQAASLNHVHGSGHPLEWLRGH